MTGRRWPVTAVQAAAVVQAGRRPSGRGSRSRTPPAGVADVVLQHPPAPELVPDQVEAHDRRPDGAAGQARRLGSPSWRALHQLAAEHAVGHDPLIAVDVAQEQFDRPSALDQADPQCVPLVRGDTRGTRSTEKRLLSPSTPNVMPALSIQSRRACLTEFSSCSPVRRKNSTMSA